MANDIFSRVRYEQTRRQIEQASPLPSDVYFSQDWYDREVETIFLKKWLIATREEEIPNPGDYVRLDIIDEPMIILRNDAGDVGTPSVWTLSCGTSNTAMRNRCCYHMTLRPNIGCTPKPFFV